MKKCSSLLGIGLDLYGRDRPGDEADNAKTPARASEPANVVHVSTRVDEVTGTSTGLCTPAQQSEIERLAKRVGMDTGELCGSLGLSDLSELTEARAQRVINRLAQLASQASGREAS